MDESVLSQSGARHNENVACAPERSSRAAPLEPHNSEADRQIRLPADVEEELRILLEKQTRTHQAEIEVRRLQQLNAAREMEFRRERLKIWGGVALSFVGKGGLGTIIVTTMGALAAWALQGG